MNDQERQIIAGIFDRLTQAADQPRDPEAERLIADRLRAQPYAPYAMAQSLYVQEEAVKSLNQQLERLKAENEQLRSHPAPASGGGGFLSGLFGGGARPEPAPQPAPSFGGRPPQSGYAAPQPQAQPSYAPQPQAQSYAPQPGPWGGQPSAPQMQQAAPAGGGFLRGALTTAAGVAGGMFVGNALMNAFSGGHHALGGIGGGSNDPNYAALGGGETVIENNYYDSDPNADAGITNAAYDDYGAAGNDLDAGNAFAPDPGFDSDAGFGSGDFGGGGGDDTSWA